MQVSVNNGSSYIATNYRHNSVGMFVNSTTIAGDSGTSLTGFRLQNGIASGGLWNNADANHNFHIRMMGIQTGATKDTRMTSQGNYAADSGSGLGAMASTIGVLPTTGAIINALRFNTAAGTISGKFTLMGLVL
jgi:hypothetical protein